MVSQHGGYSRTRLAIKLHKGAGSSRNCPPFSSGNYFLNDIGTPNNSKLRFDIVSANPTRVYAHEFSRPLAGNY